MRPANLSHISFVGIEELNRYVAVTLLWNGVISGKEMQVIRWYGKRKMRYVQAECFG